MTRKHSIVIGGTKGVGRELAGLLAAAGQHVTAVGRNPGELPESRSRGFAGNAEQADALLASLVKQVEQRGPAVEPRLPAALSRQWRFVGRRTRGGDDRDQDACSKGSCRTSIPNGDRSICVVTSNASSFVARNQTLAYHTSKAALKQMARFYAVKFGPQGIRVNVVAPCTFVKPESAAYYAAQHELQALYKRITPLARMGTAKEVAKAVAFLCGPDASFITGQELTVDGGLSLMLQDALAREVAGITG